MEVAAWLKNLDLDRYEQTFIDNAIDADILPRLTSEDLKDLGVTIVGHRRKLLDAIAALNAMPVASPRRSADIPAEHRPVTVLFCDIVGSTALAAKVGAEDWRELVGGYFDASSEAVTHFGGHVLKKLGDGLMALFGYPHAEENDAERAARAALAIVSALETLNSKNEGRGLPKLSARVGLDSGPVVVDATGEVFGEAPNIASRVQGVAEPGTVLITAAVHRHLAGLFVAEDMGARDLKGVPGLCCMDAAKRALAPARDQLRDTDADGLPEIAHTIERFDRNCDFGHAAAVVAGFQVISDHPLVTTNCRFDLRAHVIAGGLLPIHAPMLFDPNDMPVALGRRCCGSWSRHGPLAWRNDETGARVSGENGVENSAPIIGAIGHK